MSDSLWPVVQLRLVGPRESVQAAVRALQAELPASFRLTGGPRPGRQGDDWLAYGELRIQLQEERP